MPVRSACWHCPGAAPKLFGNKIRETKAQTDRPFGANLVLEWSQHERLAICLEEGVPVVSFFWGDPAPLIQRVHDAGSVVLSTVASAHDARKAVEAGVDAVVAQGWEAGGHVRGHVATLPLIPTVVKAVAPKPVVAAGGIVDGKGVAAVLALGASGAWIGTRFLASQEAAVHSHYRELLSRQKRPTRFTLACSASAGPTPLIVFYEIAPLSVGSRVAARQMVSDPARARSSGGRRREVRSRGIGPRRQRRTRRGTSKKCRFGLAKASGL